MIADHNALTCAVCGGASWLELPAVGPPSMASDWRVVPAQLVRRGCAVCGAVRSDATGHGDLFTHGYALYAHGPDDERDQARQEQYAAWIVAALEDRQPHQLLDVGCGNGSLLRALGRLWPSTTLMGCDLSRESVEYGRRSGLTLWARPAAGLPPDVRVDLAITVNVIEHTADPLSFLISLRERLSPGGLLVLVCPDGAVADVELLVADHVHSFARPHLERLFGRASLGVRAWKAAPEALGAFQMVVAAPDACPSVGSSFEPPDDMIGAKARYLDRWARLDVNLVARLDSRPVTCFGLGETAGLLRAYAPRVWQRVRACTADRLAGPSFDDVPAIALAELPPDEPLLVGVRPRDQARVAAALRRRFSTVVTWYDLVPRD
jgi:SAM-dependent methyltransferase